MKTVSIVYFHGYGSSPNSDKVAALRAGLKDRAKVYAYPADIDPEIAQAELTKEIDSILAGHRNVATQASVIFIGTSLGGWWASRLGASYGIPAIIINPACDPAGSLAKYGVAEEICSKYRPISFSKDNVYFFAEVDQVIDNVGVRNRLIAEGYRVHVDPEGDHRFGGKAFERVIELVWREYLA